MMKAHTYDEIHADYMAMIEERQLTGSRAPLTAPEWAILRELERAERKEWTRYALDNSSTPVHDE